MTTEAERALGDLLAIIHRDGGYYTETHGLPKSVEDAHRVWAELIAERDALFREAALAKEWRDHDKERAEKAEAEVARLKALLREAQDALEWTMNEDVGAALNRRIDAALATEGAP